VRTRFLDRRRASRFCETPVEVLERLFHLRPHVELAQLKALLAPCLTEDMICWPVSLRVGNVKNNDPSLIEPVIPGFPAMIVTA
jgi:hypothetical protein